MFRLTTFVPIYELTYILLSFLAFQIAKYLLYINDRIVNVCKYIYIYLTYLSAPMSIPLRCSTEPKSILKFQNQTHINHVSRKKGFDEPILSVVFKRDYHKIHSFLCINCQTTPVLREKRSLNLFVEVTLRRNSFPEVYLS